MTLNNISSHVNVRHCCECQGESEYYCLTCEKNLCPECKMKHLMILDTKDHNITLYKYKNKILHIREPCKNHPNHLYEKYCDVCNRPFCVDCTEHKEHRNRDVITVYEKHKEFINNISRNTLYDWQVLLKMIKQDFTTCNKKLDFILSDMTRELQRVKDQLDAVSIEAYIKLHLHRITQNQTAAMNKHLSKIKVVDTIHHKFAHKPVKCIRFMKKTRFPHMNMTPFRVQHCLFSTTKMDVRDLPIFRNEITHTERGKRNIRRKDLLRLMSVPELQNSSTFKTFTSCEHISCVTREKVWISERNKLFLIDITRGSILHTINDIVDGWWWGLHTVNIDRDLFFISNNNSIIKLSSDRKTAKIILDLKDVSFQLRCLYCSPFTDDLVIGMKFLSSISFGVVGRLKKSGQIDITLPEGCTYKDPNYITENNNGDIVVSDYWCGVVVTDRRGKHRFSYTETPFGSRLLPRGICTDALSHILVCDFYTETVHILDKDGKFLLNIPREKSLGPLAKPCSLSYDWNSHLLWVGSWGSTVSMYRHINRHLNLTATDNREMGADNSSEVPRCFNNPMHLEELESVLSLYVRLIDEVINLPEVPTSLPDRMNINLIEILKKMIEEFHKSVTLRALKYNISKNKAEAELLEELNSKIIAVGHAIAADKIMKILEENGKGEMFKIILQEIESYVLNAAQKTQKRNLQHIIQRMYKENNSLLQVMAEFRELMEKIGNLINGNISVQEARKFTEDVCNLISLSFSIFIKTREIAEDQQMLEIEMV